MIKLDYLIYLRVRVRVVGIVNSSFVTKREIIKKLHWIIQSFYLFRMSINEKTNAKNESVLIQSDNNDNSFATPTIPVSRLHLLPSINDNDSSLLLDQNIDDLSRNLKNRLIFSTSPPPISSPSVSSSTSYIEEFPDKENFNTCNSITCKSDCCCICLSPLKSNGPHSLKLTKCQVILNAWYFIIIS
jgi:hypothetical protein